MKWLFDLFKTKTTPPGVVKPEPEVRSCSCDTEMKLSVCVYPPEWHVGTPLKFMNLCKKCIANECKDGSFVEFL